MSQISLELPVFAPDQVAWRQTDYQGSSESPDTFVRTIRVLSVNHQVPLEELFDIADEEYDRLAKQIGAVVLPHTWGLIPVADTTPYNDHQMKLRSHPDTPGYLLGAEVERINNPKPLRGYEQLKAADQILSYTHQPNLSLHGLILHDMDERQLSTGTTRTIRKSSVILHDIELFLRPIN